MIEDWRQGDRGQDPPDAREWRIWDIQIIIVADQINLQSCEQKIGFTVLTEDSEQGLERIGGQEYLVRQTAFNNDIIVLSYVDGVESWSWDKPF